MAWLLPHERSRQRFDNVWTDVAAVDGHARQLDLRYYFKRFGRSGLDGRNGPIDIVVTRCLSGELITVGHRC